jgi:hypothetical protein
VVNRCGVRTWWSAFERSYLQLDRRVLGSFRAALGVVLLYDLLRRFPDAGLLWSSEGVLSADALLRAPQASPQVSFLLGFSSAASVNLAFVGLGLVFALYAAGLFTKVVQVLALLGYASLNARNLFFEDGGTSCVILLLGWTLLLPLHDRFSLDAVRRDAALHRLKDRVAARAAARRPLVSLAALALLLQAAAIYWLNAAHKTGATWRHGDAVHLVLWQHRVNTPFALWFAAHEPAWLSPLLTSLTRRTEFLLPVVLLWPSHPVLTRSAAFVVAVLLHGGIALCLTLGPFSYAMICLVWLAVPGAALDVVAEKLPRAHGWSLARVRARVVRSLRRRFHAARPGTLRSVAPSWSRRLGSARELVIGGMLLIEAANMLASNRAIPKVLKQGVPDWLSTYKQVLRGHQAWSMFAPDAPLDDGSLVVDAVTSAGRHIDPFTASPPDFEQIRRGVSPHSIALSDYFFAMRQPRHARYRRDLNRYFKAYRVPGSQERLRSVDVWWVSYRAPARGSTQPGPLRKEKLWRSKW